MIRVDHARTTFLEDAMSPEVHYALCTIHLVRGWAARQRREGRSEIGASAIEWAIISAVVVVLALGLAALIRSVVTKQSGSISSGVN